MHWITFLKVTIIYNTELHKPIEEMMIGFSGEKVCLNVNCHFVGRKVE